MYISYDYYRVFYYVTQYGSITQAAKILLNSQPNLTRTIKKLESELGVSAVRAAQPWHKFSIGGRAAIQACQHRD